MTHEERMLELRRFYRSKYRNIPSWLIDQFAAEALNEEQAKGLLDAQGSLSDDEMSEQDTEAERDEYLDNDDE